MKTIKEKAQEMYPVEEKAECYTAFLEGAEKGRRLGCKQGVQAVLDRILTAMDNGRVNEDEVLKIFNAISER